MYLIGDIGNSEIKVCLVNSRKQIIKRISFTSKNISLKKSLNNIILFVDDNGPGIPNNEKENVLKPFYKIFRVFFS